MSVSVKCEFRRLKQRHLTLAAQSPWSLAGTLEHLNTAAAY